MRDTEINSTGLKTVGSQIKDRSIATLAGTSELLMAGNALRKGLLISNSGSSDVFVTWTTTTAASGAVGTFRLIPGQSIGGELREDQIPVGPIYVLGTAGQPVYAEEILGFFPRA